MIFQCIIQKNSASNEKICATSFKAWPELVISFPKKQVLFDFIFKSAGDCTSDMDHFTGLNSFIEYTSKDTFFLIHNGKWLMKYLCAFMVLTEVQARIFADSFTLLCIKEGNLFNVQIHSQ